jgi:hypothetical protein
MSFSSKHENELLLKARERTSSSKHRNEVLPQSTGTNFFLEARE